MTLYVYCLTDAALAAALEGIEGVAGAPPRLLPQGEIHAVVSDFEGEQVAVTRESVFAHERVIQSVLRERTPLPFRFGTIVSGERLGGFVAENLEALSLSFKRVRGCVEMSVKIIWDRESERYEALRAEKDKGEEHASAEAGAGTAYLTARRREIHGDEQLEKRAREIADRLTKLLGETVNESRVEVRPAGQLVVRAAFLVEKEQLHSYQERVEEARKVNSGLRFLTSGPWPPYSFSIINP